jgi:hypothetical protein
VIAASTDHATVQAQAGDADDARLVRRALLVILFASIFLQRFAVPLGDGVSINLLVTLGALTVLAVRQALTLDPRRGVLVLLFATCVATSTALNAASASIASVVLALLIYVPYAFSLRPTGLSLRTVLSAFQTMMLVCAVAGIAQFLLQFVRASRRLFTFEDTLPSFVLMSGFNTVIPLSWESPLFKSNGFFFLEPSIFSQYLAIAIVIELLLFAQMARLLAYGVALLLSYSGTGLLLLALLVPCILLSRPTFGKFIGVLGFAAIAVAAADLWQMDALRGRMGELGESGSSATARFLGGAWLISDFLLATPEDVLFGLGPGAFARYALLVGYDAHDAAWAKLLFEYGVVGSAAFWPMFLAALFSGRQTVWWAVALTIGFLTFGGMLLDPRLHALILAFCVLPRAGTVSDGGTTPRLGRGAAPRVNPSTDRDDADLAVGR